MLLIGTEGKTTGRPRKNSYRNGRKCFIGVRMTREEVREMEELCDIFGLTKTDLVCSLVHETLKKVRKNK